MTELRVETTREFAGATLWQAIHQGDSCDAAVAAIIAAVLEAMPPAPPIDLTTKKGAVIAQLISDLQQAQFPADTLESVVEVPAILLYRARDTIRILYAQLLEAENVAEVDRA